MTRLLLVLILLALSMLACGNDGRAISEDDYGIRWPLTVSEATLHCRYVEGVRGVMMVWVESKGYSYPVNGTAKSTLKSQMSWLKVRNFDIIWRADMSRPGYMVNVKPLLNDGLEMCESG